MNFLRSLSIKIKILSLAVIAIIGFLVNLIIGYNLNTDNTNRLTDIQQVYFPTVEESKANIVRLARIEELFSTAVSTGEMDFIKTATQESQNTLNSFKKLQQLWPERNAQISQLQRDFESYFQVASKISVSMLDGSFDPMSMDRQIEQMNTGLEVTRKAMIAYSDSSLEAFNKTVSDSNAAAEKVQSLSLMIAIITLVIMISAAWAISSLLNEALSSLLTSLRAIASGDGDLTQRIEKRSEDELGQVVDSFNLFIEKLHNSISELLSNTQPLTSVASDLNSLTGTTKQATEEQRRATEAVSYAMDNMVVSMTQVSTNAGLASETAQEADSLAKEGRGVVNQTVTSIKALAQEVEKTSDVIRKLESDTSNVGSILDVIRGIAEQTNLLALNAAIEAARAGEQGRGFAVVADEVRTLASRTQHSTKEIQNVIEQLQEAAVSAVKAMEDSQEQAHLSVENATKTDTSLEQITDKIGLITQMNAQIATVIDQEQQSILNIKDNVQGIESTSNEAMKGMQQVEASSRALTNIADAIRHVTGQFRV